jgi:hypothetical protein
MNHAEQSKGNLVTKAPKLRVKLMVKKSFLNSNFKSAK